MKPMTPRIAVAVLALGASASAFAQVIIAEPSPPPSYEVRSAPPAMQMPSYAVVATDNSVHSGGATAADTLLALDVASALSADQRLKGTTITVSSLNGNVSISGSAVSADQASRAEQVARGIAGVSSVSGTLSTTGG